MNYLARLLHESNLGPAAMVAGLAIAFALGAVHALSPGHGKAIVAAYLVGARSTARHAAMLGLTVTVTHTAAVFGLGFATLFLSHFAMPEKIYPLLGTVSGLAIVWVGGTLFAQRLRAARKGGAPHRHAVPEGDVSTGSLMALGASGGMVPCPSALVLLLSSVSLGRIGLGLTLLLAFSAGLAVVLVGVGMAAVFGKRWLPDGKGASLRYLPVVSAAFIACVGVAMTVAALGLVRIWGG